MTFTKGFIYCLIGLTYLITLIWVLVVKSKEEFNKRIISIYLRNTTIISWTLFIILLFHYNKPYYQSIDPVDTDYSPFSNKHGLSLLVFLLLSFRGIYVIWKKKIIPPLLLIIYVTSIIIGIILCIQIIFQLSDRHDSNYYIDSESGYLMIIAPVNHIIISIFIIIKTIFNESEKSQERYFKNIFLNFLNSQLIKYGSFSIWTIIILLPFYILLTVILIVLGQNVDSLVKVFTETTTWYYSQKSHQPYLDHKGHYLCTVAACGNPKIVKPIRLGTRHGNTIIINRQLMIANAFEELIQVKYPKIHNTIRRIYDKYGYPLSKKINTIFWSNFTYFSMKPLEWLFLIFIYLSNEKPEELINRQYYYSPK